MNVAPLRLDLGPQRPVASVVIGNAEQTEIAVQAEAVAWSQEGGQDVYTPTRDVLINPSIFKIPAGGQQIVRVGLQVGALPTERSYRLFIRQLPQDRPSAPTLGLQTLLRIGLPLFVAPTETKESLDWKLERNANGGLELVTTNGGSAHIQFTSVVVRRESGAELVRKTISLYVLAGKSAALALEIPASADLPPDTPLRVELIATGDRALNPVVLRVPHAPAAAR